MSTYCCTKSRKYFCTITGAMLQPPHQQRTEVYYKKVLNYLEFLRTIYGDDANFICGYEAGCLGYTLYHQLTANNIKCIILAPTTMLEQRSKKRIKTDKRDAEIIAKCLAQHNYSPVHIPTAKDEETKEFLRMRDDHKLALKKVKQQILAFCLPSRYPSSLISASIISAMHCATESFSAITNFIFFHSNFVSFFHFLFAF